MQVIITALVLVMKACGSVEELSQNDES